MDQSSSTVLGTYCQCVDFCHLGGSTEPGGSGHVIPITHLVSNLFCRQAIHAYSRAQTVGARQSSRYRSSLVLHCTMSCLTTQTGKKRISFMNMVRHLLCEDRISYIDMKTVEATNLNHLVSNRPARKCASAITSLGKPADTITYGMECVEKDLLEIRLHCVFRNITSLSKLSFQSILVSVRIRQNTALQISSDH